MRSTVSVLLAAMLICLAVLFTVLLRQGLPQAASTAQVSPDAPTAVATAAPPVTATTASPLPTPTATPDAVVGLDDYHFGPPQPVFESPSSLFVGDWLPDSRTLSLVRYSADPATEGMEEIVTLDTATGEIRTYGRRAHMFVARKPVWLADTQQMAFLGGAGRGTDEGALPVHLWITSAGTITLTTPALEYATTVTGQGRTVLALQRDRNEIVSIDAQTGEQDALPVDLASFGLDVNSAYVQMLRHPTRPLVAISVFNKDIRSTIQPSIRRSSPAHTNRHIRSPTGDRTWRRIHCHGYLRSSHGCGGWDGY